MNAIVIQALVRHILTAIAGGFAVRYGVDGATVDAIIGGAAAAAAAEEEEVVGAAPLSP